MTEFATIRTGADPSGPTQALSGAASWARRLSLRLAEFLLANHRIALDANSIGPSPLLATGGRWAPIRPSKMRLATSQTTAVALQIALIFIPLFLPCGMSQCVFCPPGQYDTGAASPILCSYMNGDNNYFSVRLINGEVEGAGWGSCSTDMEILPADPNFSGYLCGDNGPYGIGSSWCQIGCVKLLSLFSTCAPCQPSTYSATDGVLSQ